MIEVDEKYISNLIETVSKMPNKDLGEEVEKYLKKRIENNGKEIPNFVDGKISNFLEYIAYSSILSIKIGEEEFYKTYQDLMVPAGLLKEEEKIDGGYLS